jgi:hypothetical protein
MTNEKLIMNHFVNRKYHLTCAYARNCLYLLLKALKIGEGDEVIVPAYTCLSISKTIQVVGAVPIYIDCDPNSINMNPDLIRGRLSSRSKLIYIIHAYGISAKLNEICKIAKENSIFLVEDISHSYYNEYQHKKLGTFGDFTIVSLTKLLINYQGAIIATDDKDTYDEMQRIKMDFKPNTKKVKYLPFYIVRILSAWFERDGSIISLLLFNMLYIILRVKKNGRDEASNFNYDFFYMSRLALFLTKKGIKKSKDIIDTNLYIKFKKGCSSFLTFPEILDEQTGTSPNHMGGFIKNHKKLYYAFSLKTWNNIHMEGSFSNADRMYSNFRIFSKLFVKVVWYLDKCSNRKKCK